MAALAIVALPVGTASAQREPAAEPQTNVEPDLATGPYSTMEMLLERTIFKANVLRAEVTVGEQTQAKLKNLAEGKSYSQQVNNEVARTLVDAQDMRVRIEFVRDISFDQYMDAVTDNMKCAQKTKFISEEQYKDSTQRIRENLSALKDRGVKSGDVLIYELKDNKVETTYLANGEKPVASYVREGEGARYTLLGSYFAPCSDFRDKLVQSLFQEQGPQAQPAE